MDDMAELPVSSAEAEAYKSLPEYLVMILHSLNALDPLRASSLLCHPPRRTLHLASSAAASIYAQKCLPPLAAPALHPNAKQHVASLSLEARPHELAMDRDRHGRSTSSFRISIPRSGPSSGDSLTRRPKKRRRGTGGTALDLLEDARGWLGGRIGRGTFGVRRWTLLVGFAALFGLWTLLVGEGEGIFGGGQALGDDVEVPKVDRTALDKLRLLELHLGADEENEADEGMPSRDEPAPRVPQRPKVQFQKPAEVRDDAPPLVAEIPNVFKPDPLAPPPLPRMQAAALDAEVCPERDGAPCSFLVPAWLGEQETKAQQHLYQLGLLAVTLNRTLVLPNVQKSRLGTCYANPFSFYYAADSLSRLGIPTISHADFASWTQRRDPPASAQVVSLVTAKATYTQGAIEIDSASDPNLVPGKPTRNLCLRPPRTRLDFTGYSPLAIFPPEGYHKNEAGRLNFGESLVNTLNSEEVGAKSSRASTSSDEPYSLPNVYAFNYELRFPMMSPAVVTSFAPDAIPPLPFAHFPYAETWTDLADLVIKNLSPFIAIHWRTETLAPANLAPCASSLIRKLVQLKAKYPEISNVYLATDYPIEELESEGSGGTPHSGTFAKVVTEQHHSAFRAFLRDFKKQAKGLHLTTFGKQQRSLELPSDLKERLALSSSSEDDEPKGLEALDSGLYGILDKAIAVKAEVFLTGVPGVGSSTVGACAKLSSFTNQLIEARESIRSQQLDPDGEEEQEEDRRAGQLWNSVSHWALKGDVDD